jgi:hypothetical protein
MGIFHPCSAWLGSFMTHYDQDCDRKMTVSLSFLPIIKSGNHHGDGGLQGQKGWSEAPCKVYRLPALYLTMDVKGG